VRRLEFRAGVGVLNIDVGECGSPKHRRRPA
jgi:hypothetical protein